MSFSHFITPPRARLAARVVCMAAVAGAISASASVPCAELKKLEIPGLVISQATAVPAHQPFSFGGGFGPPVMLTSLPAHCLVHGEVNQHTGADGKEYGDKFELRMPDDWQGRLLFEGGGGLDGILQPALGLDGAMPSPQSRTALDLGYAVVSDNGGHESATPMPTDGSFGSDRGARDDYNYRSTKLVTDVARQILAKFYGSPVHYAYFRGCSNGGREGMKAGEMYPEEFDGIIAGSPAFNLTHAAMAEAWSTQQLASIAPKRPEGMPDLSQSLTEGDLTLLANAVVKKCDELDGLKDGMILNPEACHFDPATIACREGQTEGCLSPQKVDAVRKINAGPHDSAGKPIYSSWPYDAGINAPGWRMWMTGLGPMPAFNVVIFPAFFNGLALAGVPPPIDVFKFDFDKDPARVDKASQEINATSTDWARFRRHKGKLLLYVGMSDPVFSPVDLIRYYRELVRANDPQFSRLFLVPGMNHCAGGPGLDTFDALGAMQAWVEKGTAPESMTATGMAFPGRSRPLCAYPKVARYGGQGSSEDAKNFVCEAR